MTALDDLRAHDRATQALAQVMGRLGWDQETMMPKGAAAQRAEEMAALEAVLHARRTDPRIGDWLDAATPQTEADAAILREIRRSYSRNTKIPERLATEIARATSRAQGIWAEARAAEDTGAFLPTLEKVVALRREEGQALADGGDVYDALLSDYEPGMTGAQIAALFDRMRPRLVALRDAVMDKGPAPMLTGPFDTDTQLALSARIARAFGYDLDRGRIDLAVHPFSSGSGQDVRITTRVDADDPLGCLYSTIHEVGHASYEQRIDPAYGLTAIGQGASMGVHESQSRIYENQLARSPAFCAWLFDEMRARFGAIGVDTPEDFTRAVNAVRPGFIRTEADEVQYNLHIMLRFDLERALMAGDLPVTDLEAAWNDRFAADFGRTVPKPSDGMLQDVHWSVGLFGYFPTYTLGNVYAGCLHRALRADLPDLDTHLAQGDPSPATHWLHDRLQRHGTLRAPQDTIRQATGAEITEAPLLAYLEDKFTALFDL